MMKKKRNVILMLVLFVVITMLMTVNVESTCKKKEDVKDHVLLFCSDIHEKAQSNLKTLLEHFQKQGMEADYICYGGDYAGKFQKEALEQVRQLTKRCFPKASILMTTGNHDQIGYQEKEFSKITKQESPRMRIEEKGYCIYMLGASTKEQCFTEKDIEDLRAFLEEKKEMLPKIPLFVVSHYPIHYYKDQGIERTTKHAKEMIELLNGYSNVIFLYGHNHTINDTNYNVVHMPGDDLEIEKDTYMGIHFPYTAMGAVKDGAGQDVYGLKVTIEHNMCCNKVIFEHVNLHAEPKDKMMICFPVIKEE